MRKRSREQNRESRYRLIAFLKSDDTNSVRDMGDGDCSLAAVNWYL